MKSDQKRRAIQIVSALQTRGATVSVDPIIALLQELIDAPEQAGVPFWHVVVSKQAPFIDRAIRREDVAQEYAAEQRENGLHDVTVIPLYAAPQAPERAAQKGGES